MYLESLGVDDFWDAELGVRLVGSILKEAFGREAFHRLVGTHFVRGGVGVRHGLDALDVNFGKLLDVLHDSGELRAEALYFFFA